MSDTHLPTASTISACLDATFFDVDADGDLDVALGNEHLPNLLFLNDGTGHFEDASDRWPTPSGDSEEIEAIDFDGDGDLDLIVASEDSIDEELWGNLTPTGAERSAIAFEDLGHRLPRGDAEGARRSNSLVAFDANEDGRPDLLLGNAAPDRLLVQSEEGEFVPPGSLSWAPPDEVTQDLEVGDLDQDGDLDIVTAGEGPNRIWLRDGESLEELEWVGRDDVRETRDVDLVDFDDDGDLDLFFSNVGLRGDGGSVQNQLFRNEGDASFDDVTDLLPVDQDWTMGAEWVDLDEDGDLDFVTANYGESLRGRALTPYRTYRNDGAAGFVEDTTFFPPDSTGHGFDLEVGDLNADGRPDFYLCSGRSRDRLVLSGD